jgi:hypothetical protein
MFILKLLLIWICFFSTLCHAVDLREYFPDNNTVILNRQDGTPHARYTFIKSPSGFLPLYNQFLSINKSGYHYVWRKEYFQNNAWCVATNAILFFGDDLSVTEVGDWYASTPCQANAVFGYKSAGINTGMVWSPAGGLTTTPFIVEANTWSQSSASAAYLSSGWQAYSKVGLIEELPSYTVPHGNKQTYFDVIHIVMYHGTRAPTPAPVRCGATSPISADGVYYHSYKDFNSYAIELYLAKGVGIIQESTPFIENAAYWNLPNCVGDIFTDTKAWTKYIN